jgi:hypothetical protein
MPAKTICQLISENPGYTLIGVLMIIAAAASIWLAFGTELLKQGETATNLGIGILIFWALGPPLFFFLEYHLAAESLRAAMKESRDLAANIWAAVLAILVFRLSK